MANLDFTLCFNGALPAHPDIEGIGTRIATYAQLLLAILIIALSADMRSFHSWWAILVTSIALQLAAIAQHDTLALFHVLIVTWLAFPVFAMSWVYIFLHWRRKAMPAEVMIATYFHGYLFVGFGLWVWTNVESFGACKELNNTTVFVAFGRSVNPTGWIRIVVIGIYALWGIMFIIAGLVSLVDAIPCARKRAVDHLQNTYSPELDALSSYTPSHPFVVGLVSLYNISVVVLTIWTVETMLRRNESRTSLQVDDGWTLGQISALLLLGSPTVTLCNLLKERLWPMERSITSGEDKCGDDGKGEKSVGINVLPADVPSLPFDRPKVLIKKSRNSMV